VGDGSLSSPRPTEWQPATLIAVYERAHASSDAGRAGYGVFFPSNAAALPLETP